MPCPLCVPVPSFIMQKTVLLISHFSHLCQCSLLFCGVCCMGLAVAGWRSLAGGGFWGEQPMLLFLSVCPS